MPGLRRKREKTMTTIDLKAVERTANEFSNDIDAIAKELKKVQSVKCRLKKQSGRANYNELMTDVLKREELLKAARQLIEPKEKAVTMYEQSDVDMLDYDETIKALRSIQSKKTLTRWLTDKEGDNDEFRNACRIEKMLQERRDKIRPVDNEHIRKTDLQTIIDTIDMTADISVATIKELLVNLM